MFDPIARSDDGSFSTEPNHRTRTPSLLCSPLVSLAVASLLLALLTTMLALTPQNGDGAEVVMTAIHGGVMHPPGFPLLAWLTRLAVKLPLGNPVERIAFLNSSFHAATLFLLLETFRHIGVRFLPGLTASLAYAFFPSVWYLSTQTEVFSLAYFLMALLTWYAVVRFKENPCPVRLVSAIGLGIIAGLGLAQHPVVATGVGSFLFAWNGLRRSAGRILSPSIWVPFVVVAIVVSGAYWSLLALRTSNTWPDWGQLRDMADVIRHATRAEYGVFTLSSIEGVRSARGISVMGHHLLRHWNLLLLALFVAPRRGWVWMLWINSLLACAFLILAKVPDNGALAWAALERFEGTLLLPATLLLGLGLDRFRNHALHATGLAIVLLGAVLSYSSANSRTDDTMSVYRHSLADSLPPQAVYVAAQDLEIFNGVPTRQGSTRFPISAGLFEFPWYHAGILPTIEPSVDARSHATLRQLIADIVHDRRSVYTTEPQIYDNPPMACSRDGLFFVASLDPPSRSPIASLRRVKRLCSSARQLNSLPPRGHNYSRLLYYEYADALTYYAQEMARAAPSNNTWVDLADLTQRAAQGMWRTTDRREWQSACESLDSLAALATPPARTLP